MIGKYKAFKDEKRPESISGGTDFNDSTKIKQETL